MGIDTTGMSEWEIADRWFDEMEQLLRDLEIKPGCLADQFGLREKDLEHIVNVYQNDFCSQGNPKEFDFQEVLSLLKQVMHNPY
jgi:alcohol dehydrogenase class IV